MEAMKKVVIERYEAFSTAGNAEKIQPIGLEVMSVNYESGFLSPKVR